MLHSLREKLLVRGREQCVPPAQKNWIVQSIKERKPLVPCQPSYDEVSNGSFSDSDLNNESDDDSQMSFF